MKTKKVNRSLFGTICITLILFVFGAFMALPMVYVFTSAFKPLEEIFLFPPKLYVMNPTLENFTQMAKIVSNMWVPFSRYMQSLWLPPMKKRAESMILASPNSSSTSASLLSCISSIASGTALPYFTPQIA